MYANVEFINEITNKKTTKRKATKYNNPELDRYEWSARGIPRAKPEKF